MTPSNLGVVIFFAREKNMNRRAFIASTGVAILGLRNCPNARADEPTPIQSLNELLESVRKKHDLPGFAAAAVRDGKLVARGVAGIREIGKPGAIEIDDRFGIGSCTKRMTSFLIMRLVDAGKLKFESTLAAALPDIQMRDAYRPVTLAQLLTFRGGIQPYEQIGPRITPVLFEKGTVPEVRAKFISQVLNEEPIGKVGEMRYSNASYILVGEAAQRLCKQPFESLMAEHVFKPLGMSRSGFGRPRNADRPSEPWQHVQRPNGYQPIPVRDSTIEGVMAAPGGVHCSIGDFAKFAACMLATARGQFTLLKPATVEQVKKLLRQEGFGGGDDFGGTQWLHAGMRIAPGKKLAIVTAVNGGDAEDACIEAFDEIEKRL